jgi:hypothetical protein
MNMTSVKDRRRWSKNKICCTLNITFLIVLPAILATTEQHILKSKEPAIHKLQTITESKDCNSLASRESSIVLKRDILCHKIVSHNKE